MIFRIILNWQLLAGPSVQLRIHGPSVSTGDGPANNDQSLCYEG